MTLKINLVLLSIFKNNVQVPFIYDFRKLFNKMFFHYQQNVGIGMQRNNSDPDQQFTVRQEWQSNEESGWKGEK